jgi:large subunit ribosomal protein L7/L12
MNKDEVLEAIKGMSVLELADLVKQLQDEFGISAAPVAAAPAAAAATGAVPGEAAAPEEEEKTEFNIILQEVGANKINVIKAVREVTTLGLREAKELVEGAPKAVRESVNKEEADQIREKLEAAGAKVAVE